MGIRTKFNLVLFAVAALAFALFAFVATPIFQAEKKEEILEQARLLMESAQAIRDYTSEEIAPVLDHGDIRPHHLQHRSIGTALP